MCLRDVSSMWQVSLHYCDTCHQYGPGQKCLQGMQYCGVVIIRAILAFGKRFWLHPPGSAKANSCVPSWGTGPERIHGPDCCNVQVNTG